jgi:hypothetical protein
MVGNGGDYVSEKMCWIFLLFGGVNSIWALVCL